MFVKADTLWTAVCKRSGLIMTPQARIIHDVRIESTLVFTRTMDQFLEDCLGSPWFPDPDSGNMKHVGEVLQLGNDTTALHRIVHENGRDAWKLGLYVLTRRRSSLREFARDVLLFKLWRWTERCFDANEMVAAYALTQAVSCDYDMILMLWLVEAQRGFLSSENRATYITSLSEKELEVRIAMCQMAILDVLLGSFPSFGRLLKSPLPWTRVGLVAANETSRLVTAQTAMREMSRGDYILWQLVFLGLERLLIDSGDEMIPTTDRAGLLPFLSDTLNPARNLRIKAQADIPFPRLVAPPVQEARKLKKQAQNMFSVSMARLDQQEEQPTNSVPAARIVVAMRYGSYLLQRLGALINHGRSAELLETGSSAQTNPDMLYRCLWALVPANQIPITMNNNVEATLKVIIPRTTEIIHASAVAAKSYASAVHGQSQQQLVGAGPTVLSEDLVLEIPLYSPEGYQDHLILMGDFGVWVYKDVHSRSNITDGRATFRRLGVEVGFRLSNGYPTDRLEVEAGHASFAQKTASMLPVVSYARPQVAKNMTLDMGAIKVSTTITEALAVYRNYIRPGEHAIYSEDGLRADKTDLALLFCHPWLVLLLAMEVSLEQAVLAHSSLSLVMADDYQGAREAIERAVITSKQAVGSEQKWLLTLASDLAVLAVSSRFGYAMAATAGQPEGRRPEDLIFRLDKWDDFASATELTGACQDPEGVCAFSTALFHLAKAAQLHSHLFNIITSNTPLHPFVE